MVARAVNVVARGFQLLWSILVMALIGNMIATAFAGNPAVVNYDMFVAAFAMFTLLFYLIPVTVKEDLGIPILTVTLDFLNTIFWLCAGIATAAELTCHSCSNSSYTHHNRITNGSHNTQKRCREAQASTAFLWFGFAAFAVSLVISFMQSRGSANMRGGARRPNMSQV